ncbi:MAG: outer membrane beta-barrel protein [Desulfobacterales bacterium]
MKRLFLSFMVLFITVCLGLINAANADETSFNRHLGPFAEASAGYTYGWASGEIAGSDFAEGAAIGFGWSIGGGYMFKDWIGAEAGYLQFNPKVEADGYEPEVTVGGLYLTSRFNIPVKERFSVVLKAGVMSLSLSEDEYDDAVSTGAPFTGIGIGYALTEKIDLRAQFQGPNFIFIGAGVLSAAVTYHF